MFLAAPEKDFVIKSSIPATSFMQKRISLYLHKKDAEQKGHKKQTFPIRFLCSSNSAYNINA